MKVVLDAANTALAEGRHADAAPLLEQLLERSPNNAELLRALALIYSHLKDWTRARDFANRLVALGIDIGRDTYVVGAHLLLDALTMARDESGIAQAWQTIRPVLEQILAQPADQSEKDRIFGHASQAAIQARDSALGEMLLRWRFRKAVGITLPATVSPTLTLREWSRHSNTPYTVMDPRRVLRLRNGAFQRDYTASEFGFVVVPHGEILSGWRYPRTPTQHVLGEPAELDLTMGNWFPQTVSTVNPHVLHLWPKDVVEIDQDVLYLSGPHNFHVGHWIIDFLPRLRALAHPDARGFQVAIPRQLPEKCRDFLDLFGIERRDLVECELGTRYRFRNLLVVDAGHPHHPSPETTASFGDRLRAPYPTAGLSTRLFMVRSVPTRQIANMTEVQALLASYGFEYIDLATSPMSEQRSRLGAADIAISIYGSDLLGMMFMQEGSDFIELTYAEELDCTTDNMHSVLKINFHLFLCTPLDGGEQRLKKDKDFIVDCRKLDALLTTILARKAAGIRFQSPMSLEAV